MKNDDAYANAAYIPNADAFAERWEQAAFDFRALENSCGRVRLNLPYGDDPRMAFDLFLPSGRPKGLMVFVHGGYWIRCDRTDWSHFARGALDADFAVAMPSYPLAPQATIPQMSNAISAAIAKAADMVPGPIHLTGHSAGGHLVARMAMAGMLPDAVAARVAKIVPISPVADLRPLLETSMNAQLNLTPEVALSESPSLQSKSLDVPVHVWVGGDERPAFLAQAQGLAQAWDAPLTIEDGLHHFDIIDGLERCDSPLIQAVLHPG